MVKLLLPGYVKLIDGEVKSRQVHIFSSVRSVNHGSAANFRVCDEKYCIDCSFLIGRACLMSFKKRQSHAWKELDKKINIQYH